ncbi:MAG: hypothetical protein Q8L14_25905 [Myxococcales bacterium]|nr:hypothetical protein [Myxococcales bacterium]
MTFSSTRGQLRPNRLRLSADGTATTRFQCFPTDEGPCAGDVRIEVRLDGDRASMTLLAVPGDEPAHVAGVTTPESGLGAPARPDGGGPQRRTRAGWMGTAEHWWHWDGGVFVVTPDEETDFDCSWDGGAHPGYTLPNGIPSATGCDGEPIDVVLWEDDAEEAVDFCGTVTFTRPLTEPLYPRAAYRLLKPIMKGHSTTCCSRFFCLRDPSSLRYRLRLRHGWRSTFSVGARTRHFGASLFGKAPVELDTTAVPAGSVVRLPTFQVGDGYRGGDSPPGGKVGGAPGP